MDRKKIAGLLFSLVIAGLFVSLFVYSEDSRNLILSDLLTAAGTVIPAVFPFAVLGSLVGSGVADIPRFLKRAVSFVFGVEREGALALACGLFTGFPVGAAAAAGLYKRGLIDARDACRIVAFSSTPSLAFIVSGVGGGMFKNTKIGIEIYLFTIISVFLVGFLTRKRRCENKPKIKTEADFLSQKPLSGILCDAITKSGGAMVTLVAFIVIFSQSAFFLSKLLSFLCVPESVSEVALGFLEITLGCKTASSKTGDTGVLYAILFASFGGLSMQMQSASVCSLCNIPSLSKRVLFLRSLVTLAASGLFLLSRVALRLY